MREFPTDYLCICIEQIGCLQSKVRDLQCENARIAAVSDRKIGEIIDVKHSADRYIKVLEDTCDDLFPLCVSRPSLAIVCEQMLLARVKYYAIPAIRDVVQYYAITTIMNIASDRTKMRELRVEIEQALGELLRVGWLPAHLETHVICNSRTNPPEVIDAGELRGIIEIQHKNSSTFWSFQFKVSSDGMISVG
jgi:hypothetical protein